MKALLEQARQLQKRNEAEEILMAAIAMADPTSGSVLAYRKDKNKHI